MFQQNVIADDRGKVFPFLRADSAPSPTFGEVYFSLCKPGVIKGWHCRRRATRYYACPVGKIQVVMFDTREESVTVGCFSECILGEEDYMVLKIPPQVWSSFRNLEIKDSLVADFTDHPFSPSDAEKLPINNPVIPWAWVGPIPRT